jgi:hypothetical protein
MRFIAVVLSVVSLAALAEPNDPEALALEGCNLRCSEQEAIQFAAQAAERARAAQSLTIGSLGIGAPSSPTATLSTSADSLVLGTLSPTPAPQPQCSPELQGLTGEARAAIERAAPQLLAGCPSSSAVPSSLTQAPMDQGTCVKTCMKEFLASTPLKAEQERLDIGAVMQMMQALGGAEEPPNFGGEASGAAGAEGGEASAQMATEGPLSVVKPTPEPESDAQEEQ